MNSKVGSEWRKWDFHIHTPFSILNNQFGLNANKPEDFDKYVTQLFTKAVDKDIWAIGITDYFSIDGYKRIRNDYLDNLEKMAELFPDSEMRDRIGRMLIFPNIEFRLNKFVPKGGKEMSIGYHVLFSDEIDPEIIEENFLHKLSFAPTSGQSLPLTHRNIEHFGEILKEQNGGKGDLYKLGLESISVDEDDVLNALRECRNFNAKHIITVPVDETLCSADWNVNRNYFPKKNLYEQCHCYMTSSRKTREWALEEERILEFGAIKPCIWGSDAHSIERLFEPAEHRYCWVKADLTFEGLLQILCEPADRVLIQEDRPEQRDPHRTIASIQFHDENFQIEPIYFNEGLTCIIGGRSTGKSLLLRQLARNIAPDYALKQERYSSLGELEFSAGADVVWRDGGSGERQIIYLPQTFLNRTVDNPESKADGANAFIGNVLLQNAEIKSAFDKFEQARAEAEHSLRDAFDLYASTKVQIESAERQLVETGASALFRKREKELVEEYKALSGPGGASAEDLETYRRLCAEKQQVYETVSSIKRDEEILLSLPVPKITEPTFKGVGCYDALSTDAACRLREEIESINASIELKWSVAVDKQLAACAASKKESEARVVDIGNQIAALEPKVEHNSRLHKVMAQLNEERKMLIASEQIENRIKELQNQLNDLMSSIIKSRGEIHAVYSKYCNEIAPLSEQITSGLEFSAAPVWRKTEFCEAISEMLDGRKLRSFASTTGYDIQELNEEQYSDEFLKMVWQAVLGKSDEGALQLKRGTSEVEFLRKLFGDWYNVHYIVTSDGDRLDKMSPGKKGLVLLELIIELEQGTCPILIDQPEDDLDNQSIYTELRKYIKNSKKRRQIIIVTHNANIALGADAEEIIVANQDGIGRENGNCKFRYRSGAIENNAQPSGDILKLPFLERYSIQEHACQILDGGKEALEQRRRKYSMGV